MAYSLLASAVAKGTAANRPTVPDCPADTVQLYYDTTNKYLGYGQSGATGWNMGLTSAQGTPTAKTADATLTIAELLTGMITATKATAVAFTLPTGTLTDAGLYSGTLAVGESFDWVIVNLGSSTGAVTVGAGTDHTVVGNMVVAITTSGIFRTRKTAANTFVTYRVAG